jgi:hypothetical protein
MTKRTQLNQWNKALSKIEDKRLQPWLAEASKISPEFSTALEGIYCGREGKIKEELCDGIYIVMGWYTISDNPKVEYAYVS